MALWLLLALTAVPAPAMAADPVATACDARPSPTGPSPTGPSSTGPAATGPRIVVSVVGARKVAGNMTVTLYGPRPEAFLARGGRLARLRIPMTSLVAEACFHVSAPGIYAVAVYHDENDDHDFNRNLLGIPTEGYGFSNDAPALVGLPSFDATRFTVPAAGAKLQVKLRY